MKHMLFVTLRPRPPAALKLNVDVDVSSGTPVKLCEDLWPIFHFLMPGFLGRRKTLKETLQDDNQAIERLRQRVSPFVCVA